MEGKDMKKLTEKELEKVSGGKAAYDELARMAHTCPFCLHYPAGGGIGSMDKKTAWMVCLNPACGKKYEIYTDENAVYENATDVYTKRWANPGDKEPTDGKDFPDVQALWK